MREKKFLGLDRKRLLLLGGHLGLERKRLLLLGDHLTILGFNFGADSISEEVVGFSPFMVSPIKNCVHCLLCLMAILLILLVNDPNIMLV